MTAPITEDRHLTRRLSMASALASAWPALLLATACLLPFLNRPFRIDDPEFLLMARQILQRPLHPMDFDICWNTVDTCEKLYIVTPGNALMGYALVPTVLGGSHEWMAHLTQLLFAWIAVVAMSSLVLRFGWNRGYAMAGGLLLVAIPPFLPMASTAMPDVLATTIALVGMERLAAWKADRKWHQGAAAAVALGLAGFARPHLALLLPLGTAFLLESVRLREIPAQIRRRPWLWSPVVAGTLLLFAIMVTTHERSAGVGPPPSFSGLENIRINLRSYLLYLAFPLPLAACWVANRWKIGYRRVAVVLCLTAAVAGLLMEENKAATCLAVIGFWVLADLFYEAWQMWDQTGLFLVLWLLLPLPIAYYGHLPMKYLLPCIPAVILICFRLSSSFSLRTARAAAVVMIVAYIGYSLLILRSDAEFADFGRDAMDHLIRPQVEAGKKVWYTGQFWSYWYAPKAGGTLLVPGVSQPKPGDLIIVGQFEGSLTTLQRYPKRTLVETFSHTYRFGRTMGAGIGLYSNRVGNWLWGAGYNNQDRFELWRID